MKNTKLSLLVKNGKLSLGTKEECMQSQIKKYYNRIESDEYSVTLKSKNKTSPQNIVKYKRHRHMNIGLIFFGTIFIYLCIYGVRYFTTEKVSLYEVVAGSVTQNNTYQSLAIRKEVVVSAAQNGYINYFPKEAEKISPKSLIYSLDATGDFYHSLVKNADKTAIFQKDNKKELNDMLLSFQKAYSGQEFYQVYQMKDDIQAKLIQMLTFPDKTNVQNNSAQVQGVVPVYGQGTGVIVYSVDNMEDRTSSTVSENDFKKELYSKVNLKGKEKIAAGEPVYKLVTDDNWEIMIPADERLYQSLKKETYLQVRFLADGKKAWGQVSFQTVNQNQYLVLSFNNSVSRYAKERFLDVELFIDTIHGLKVANSCIVEKDFFVVPEQYITKGGSSNGEGILVEKANQSGKKDVQFIPVTVYKRDNKQCYISNEDLQSGMLLYNKSDQDTYQLKTKKKLKGVYNMNKGYAVFRLADILYKGKDYTILSLNTEYGVSLYDHIALEGDKIKEGQFNQ